MIGAVSVPTSPEKWMPLLHLSACSCKCCGHMDPFHAADRCSCECACTCTLVPFASPHCAGTNTLVIHNTCEDSLLAAPLMIDLVLLTELMTRITYQVEGSTEWQSFRSVLSILSYMLKAPMVPRGTPVINALMKQQRAITNLLCALVGLPVDGDMMLEHRLRL